MAKRMSGQKAVTPDAKALEASAKAAGKGGLPPVHLWNPPYCGDLDIRIHRDGSWSYLGSPINRFELVKLFSSILKLEGGKFYLVSYRFYKLVPSFYQLLRACDFQDALLQYY